ncbi:MAG TPA: ATP-binding protein [Polyangia bacterium]|jgi:signal transduction histidine kinase
MRLGTRISVTTTVLVALTLGIYGLVAVRATRSDIERGIERRTNEMGDFVTAVLDGRERDDLMRGIARLQGIDVPGMRLLVLASMTDATTQAQRMRLEQVLSTRRPFGTYDVTTPARRYALMLPIRDSQGIVVCAIELQRDASEADVMARRAALRMALTVGVLTFVLALAVWLTTRVTIGRPVERLLEGIDDVAKGDLTRVILQERDDEIGALAGRFNAMTSSLREAREETRRGVETRLQLEDKLRQSEKLATIGQLAAGIAHEVGTPLNVIGGRARTMERKVGDAAEVLKNARIIAEQSERITKIIQQLLDYTRRKGPSKTVVDLAQVARGTLDFLEHQIERNNVAARLESDGDVVLAGDADQLQQVCMNLFLNAIQAMPQGGELGVRVGRVARRKEGLSHAPSVEYAVLEVRDTGAGIAVADRDRIFEPFYSTKADGEGTGLGLAVSHGIVKDHDGWIEIDGPPHGGTIFRVFLPTQEAQA